MKEFKGTQGEWSLAHFADGTTDCGCTSVLSEYHCGAIAGIWFSSDNSIGNGLNPSIEEAKANAHLISAAPELLESLIAMVDLFPNTNIEQQEAKVKAVNAINKAFGNIHE